MAHYQKDMESKKEKDCNKDNNVSPITEDKSRNTRNTGWSGVQMSLLNNGQQIDDIKNVIILDSGSTMSVVSCCS